MKLCSLFFFSWLSVLFCAIWDIKKEKKTSVEENNKNIPRLCVRKWSVQFKNSILTDENMCLLGFHATLKLFWGPLFLCNFIDSLSLFFDLFCFSSKYISYIMVVLFVCGDSGGNSMRVYLSECVNISALCLSFSVCVYACVHLLWCLLWLNVVVAAFFSFLLLLYFHLTYEYTELSTRVVWKHNFSHINSC